MGSGYTLKFDFYAIDSWDGDNFRGNGPDAFDVSVGGARVFHNTFENYAPSQSQSYRDGLSGQGSVLLQVVPTVRGVSGQPGTDGGFTVTGSGFMESGTTVTVGGAVVQDVYPNAGPDVTGSRNSQLGGVLLPGAVEGPIRVTTAGGTATLGGLPYGAPAFVEFGGLQGAPGDGTGLLMSVGQTITLVGRGLSNTTQVQFAAADDTGFTGVVTRTGTANATGTALTVVVPAQARTGLVGVVGSPTTALLRVAPVLRSVGGTVAAGNRVVLEGTGLVAGELSLTIDGVTVDPATVTVHATALLGASQEVVDLTVPWGRVGGSDPGDDGGRRVDVAGGGDGVAGPVTGG